MLESLEKCPSKTEELSAELIEKYVLPLFSGAELSGFKESNRREKCVSSGNGYKYLFIKLKSNDSYRLKVMRAQPFLKDDKKLLELIIDEFAKISDLDIENIYKEKLYLNALEIAISKNLADGFSEVLSRIINKLSNWSERTYEGGRVSFGFIVDFEKESTESPKRKKFLDFDEILGDDFSAVLTDGVLSWMVFDKNGVALSHEVHQPLTDQDILCPLRFGSLANTTSEKRVGIVLLSNGEILLIKNKELKLAKRRGAWRSFHHEATMKQMTANSSYTNDDIIKAIYLTSLDVSFGRSGGCICYTRKSSETKLYQAKVIDDKDLLVREESIKSTTIWKIVDGQKFNHLERKLRQEIMGIDGATIIDHEGKVITSGSIISIPSGSTGGGRLAATKALSKYGIAIKISEDGMIQGFRHPEHKDVIKLFSIA